jgi:hypothetical protein
VLDYQVPDVAKMERGKQLGRRGNKLDEVSEYLYTWYLHNIWVQETNLGRIWAKVELNVAVASVKQCRIIGPSYTATTLFIFTHKKPTQ